MVIDMQSGRYKAYPEYKDSGVEWLGDIPSHWELLRGKWRFKSLKEVNRNLQCMDRLALTMRGVIERSIESDDGLQPSAFTGYQIFEKDDLVFKLIDLENYKTSRVGLVFKKGIMSPAYIRLKPNKDVSSKFFYYFYFDLYLRGIYNQIGGQGVRSALNASDLLEIQICVPSRDEQVEIADFLDHETAKIDTLIEKQQRLIELLTEKRQAVISHAVTKGLNPDVPMKDSGVEWLGEVPEHWEMKKLKHIGEAKNGLTYSPNDVTDADSGTLVLRSSNIQNAKLAFNDNVFVNVKIPKRMRTIKDDILICSRNGSRRLIGKNALITDEAAGQAFGAFMIVFRSDINTYLYWVLNSPLFEYQSGSFLTSTINQLTMGNLHNMEVPIPSREEQKEIINFLTKKMKGFDDLLFKAQQAIQLMQERRTALISAAVTGKIDVRDWVKPE